MARRARSEMIEETRGKLIAAARQIFGTVGYAAASMDEFTAAVGLTRGALYHHFGDKRGLFQAVAAQIDLEMDARLNAVQAGASDQWEGFCARCRAYLGMALDSEIQRVVLLDGPSVLGAAYTQAARSQCLTSMAEALKALMDAKVIKRGDPETLALLINGGLEDAAVWIAGSENPEARLAQALTGLEVLLEGLHDARR